MNSGVYEIRNTANGKIYIGSAINFTKRFNDHLQKLRRGTHFNSHLQAAWNKYGGDSFSLSPVFLCAKEHAVSWEQRYLDEFKPQYNKCPSAGSMLGYKFSPESSARRSAALIGNRHASGGKGKAKLPTHIAKIAAALIGNKNSLGRVRPEQNIGNIYALGRRNTPAQSAAQSARMLGRKRGPYRKKALA